MSLIKFRLLGAFEVLCDDQPITRFTTDKVRALLAYLAIEGESLRRDTLATSLWSDWGQSDARRNLRKAIYRLRQAFDSVTDDLSSQLFDITPKTIAIKPEAWWVDGIEFSTLLSTCEAHNHDQINSCAACLPRLEQAADLYGGEFLEGFALTGAEVFDEWQSIQRERFHQQAIKAFTYLAQSYELREDFPAAHSAAVRLVELEPFHEQAHRTLMRTLAISGRTNEALAQYERCRRILANELGVLPDDETIRLYERISRGEFQTRPGDERWEKLRNFPMQTTPFIGREEEINRILALLIDPECRLLSLVGPGGMGKTRLSIEVAQRLSANLQLFTAGYYFIPLVGIPDADSLIPAIAVSLGFTFSGKGPAQDELFNYLENQDILLILDNFEHLANNEELVAAILSVTRNLKILVTSRSPLNLSAEWRLTLDGLGYPSQVKQVEKVPSSAIELFLQSAIRTKPDFDPDEFEYAAIIDICRLVDGMPLALEIAATWLRLTDCQTIARNIVRDLDAMVAPLRDLPERHRSMRAIFEHSWQLLKPSEQSTLARLSVFRGSFDLEAALDICQTSLPILATLLDQALVKQTAGKRYVLHDLLHQYAESKLTLLANEPRQTEDLDEIYRRHAIYYLELVTTKAQSLKGEKAAETISDLQLDFENINQAWDQAVKNDDGSLITKSLGGFTDFYFATSLPEEGAKALHYAIDHFRSSPFGDDESGTETQKSIGRLLNAEAKLLTIQGKIDEVLQLAQEASNLASDIQDREIEAEAWSLIGWVLEGRGDYDQAMYYQEKICNRYRDMGDQQMLAKTLIRIGTIHWRKQNLDAALNNYQEAYKSYRDIDNLAGMTNSLTGLGNVYASQGRYQDSLASHQEALKIDRELGRQGRIAISLGNLGDLYELIGEYDQAIQLTQEALDIDLEVGNLPRAGLWLSNLGTINILRGDDDKAVDYLNQAIPLLQDVGQPTDLADALIKKAQVTLKLGRVNEVQPLLKQAIQIGQEIASRDIIFRGAILQAELFSAQGKSKEAKDSLEVLLSEAEGEEERAAAHYAIWQLEGLEQHHQAATKLYQDLSKIKPKAEFKSRLGALQLGKWTTPKSG